MLRLSLILVTSALLASITFAQDETRYGIELLPELYGQATPQEAVASAISVIEKRRSNYLTAHLLDPRFVDGRVNSRINELFPIIEKQLQEQRASQQRGGVPRAEQIPVNPIEFAEAVQERARQLVFNQFAGDIQRSLSENPQRLDLLKRFARAGTVDIQGNQATITLPDVPKQAVYLVFVGERWRIENRQTKAQP